MCSVGAKRAEKFYAEGYRTLEELKKYEKLTHAQKVGLEYFVVSFINEEAVTQAQAVYWFLTGF